MSQVNRGLRIRSSLPKFCLPQLKSLQGDVGRRVVVKEHPDWLLPVPFTAPEEFTDIDTPEVYARLVRNWI